jgi:hypothetical protein
MPQVIEHAFGDRQIVILNVDVSAGDVGAVERIGGDAATAPFARIPATGAFARRAGPLWIAAALLATAWTSGARGSPETRYPLADARDRVQHAIPLRGIDVQGPGGADEVERERARVLTVKSVRLAQAAPDDPGELQKAVEQEHDRAELLAHELTIHRHLEMLLTLYRARAEAARLKQLPENENSELREHLQQEGLHLKQEAESGATELCKILSGDRPEQSEQAVRATDTIELRTSLQQQRDRADRLEQDLAAAKRDLATQTALASRANEAGQAKGQAEGDAAELRASLQQEKQRGAQLDKDLAAARREVETQTALAAKAHEEATRAEGDGAALLTSLQQERDRTAQLEKDVAAARHDVETQTALASKTNEDASQAKRAAESDATALRTSLQQERERAAQLEKDVVAARHDVETQTALAAKANEEASQAKQTAESDAAALKTSLEQEKARAAQLEKDVAAARHDVETQTALLSKANLDAAQSKQVADQSSAELKRSLQKEHERAEALAKDVSMAHTTIYAYEAQVRKADDQAAESHQAGENDTATLRKALQQEQERAGRLEQDLAAARRDVGTQTALVVKANDDAARSRQAADNGSAELKRSLQKEHDRAEALAQNLSMVHTAVYTYEVQARMAGDQAVARAQSAASSAAELRKALLQEQARTARLQQDLAAARHDVETQAALAATAGAEAARLKRAADDGSAESLKVLQQERDKTARLERELAAERKTKDVPAVSGGVTAARVTQDKQPVVDAVRPVAVNQAAAAAARSNARPDPENAAEVARLVARASVLLGQGDIGSARIVLERAAETGNAQASFALAETYDPLVLRKWGAYGTLGDPEKARDLYAKAQAGGIKEARQRFEALRR